MTSPNLDHEPELIRSFDGTLLSVRAMGEGDGTPLLVANGIGANLALWRRSLADVARTRSIVTWDHRGTFGSAQPASERIDPGAHAEDAMSAMDHLDLDRFALASWSTGGRIALEIAHRYPDRVSGLVLICGTYGYALTRFLRHLEMPSALPLFASVAKHFSGLLEGPLRGLVARPEIVGLIRQSGFIAATADTTALVDFIRGMASCDLRTILDMFEAVAGDPAPDALQSIEAPTLVVAGERDPFTPLKQMEETAGAIPGARLEVYDKATHYLPIEYPARLSDDLRAFLAELPA
nr:alpha/beta hydrolase [Actinomycetota bacterium]